MPVSPYEAEEDIIYLISKNKHCSPMSAELARRGNLKTFSSWKNTKSGKGLEEGTNNKQNHLTTSHADSATKISGFDHQHASVSRSWISTRH